MDRKIILAKDYGILPDTHRDYADNFRTMLETVKGIKDGVTVKFESGVYDIYADTATKEVFYVTNTLSERDKAVPEHIFGLIIRDLTDVELDFGGATLLYHGAMTHLFIDRCEKVRIKNLTIDHTRPPYCSEITCLSKSFLKAEFKVHPDSDYELVGGDLIFKGENWSFSGRHDAATAGYIPRYKDGGIRGGAHPFRHARRIREKSRGILAVDYYLPPRVSVGETYALINIKRLESGIVVNDSDGVYFENVSQHFNMSHALVAQCSKDISLDYCNFAPEKNSDRVIASVTDFLHFNECRGKILVSNSYFEGANDDGLNVHGVNFPVVDADGKTVTIAFSHKETYGFNPFKKGDEVVFVDKYSLLDTATATVEDSRQTDPYRIQLILDKVPENAIKDTVIENLSTNPDVFYAGNYLSKISTRGVLVTTRGRVNILDNTFRRTGMCGVLIADDARSWYESGPVRSVTITGNKFTECGDSAIAVRPEVARYDGAVHKDIMIKENSFLVRGNASAIDMRYADRILVTENEFKGAPYGAMMKFLSCTDLHITDNDLEDNYVVERKK